MLGGSLIVAGAVLLIVSVPATPANLIGYGRYVATWIEPPKFLYTGDDTIQSGVAPVSSRVILPFFSVPAP